jgi:hypothetical protein
VARSRPESFDIGLSRPREAQRFEALIAASLASQCGSRIARGKDMPSKKLTDASTSRESVIGRSVCGQSDEVDVFC